MSRILFVVIVAAVLFRWGTGWRRIVGMTVIAALTAGLLFPAPVHAQFGVLGGIQNILGIINGVIRIALDTTSEVSRSMETLHREIVWSVASLNRARAAVASLAAQFRAPMDALHGVSVGSATLSAPAVLDAILRNRQTGDFPMLDQAYYDAFGALPGADDADLLARNMMDIDDGLVLQTLKTAKGAEQIGALILESGNQIEDETRFTAPGSAPFLTASAMAANIQSQAMMQKMLAAMLRQEAARIAHENALRKRDGILLVKIRQRISDMLRLP